MRYERLCDKCGQPYYRSNLVRAWVGTNFGHRAGWVRAIQRYCCKCMNAAEAQAVLKEVDPQWRLLKPQEKVAGLTPRKTKGRNHNASQHVRESAR
jgi:hypothetical protein